ncbi:MAG: hypothetical protein DSM106950_36465 [Stigonema ocellatum SAG 48.90 = DSM 106950]|nr:hypothetical protein [Stigonema ocellatum SAG 48.90 = DSM 106950]
MSPEEVNKPLGTSTLAIEPISCTSWALTAIDFDVWEARLRKKGVRGLPDSELVKKNNEARIGNYNTQAELRLAERYADAGYEVEIVRPTAETPAGDTPVINEPLSPDFRIRLPGQAETARVDVKFREPGKQMTKLKNPEKSFFTTIFIDCDLCVYVTDIEDTLNEDTSNQVLIPKAARFYFGYVMEPLEDDEEVLIASDSSVSFETSTDVWVERTLDRLGLHWQDNYSCAAKNQPLLEEALRKWEILVGKPIVEWNSRYYRDQIFKYGFKGSKNKH